MRESFGGDFFAATTPFQEGVVPAARRIYVDTSILSHPVLNELDEIKEAPHILPEVGRDNQFLPFNDDESR